MGKAAQGLLALGVALQLELAVGNAGFFLEALGAGVGHFVEGFIELAAKVKDHSRIGLRAGKRSRADKGRCGDKGFEQFHVFLPYYYFDVIGRAESRKSRSKKR